MKQKSMLKFVLSALLLSASATAFAEEGSTPTTGPVKLGDGKTTMEWAAFAAALNNPDEDPDVSAAQADLQAAQSAYTKAQNDYDQAVKNITLWQAQINAWKTDKDAISKSTPTWLTTPQRTAKDYDKTFSSTQTSDSVFYTYDDGDLTLSFADENPGGYTQSTLADFYTKFVTNESKNPISYLYVYLGKNSNGKFNYTLGDNGMLEATYGDKPRSIFKNVATAITSVINAGTFIEEVNAHQSDIDDLQKKLDALINAGTDGKTDLDKLYDKIAPAKQAFEYAQTALNTAKEDAPTKYANVTLTGNVNADTRITKEYDGHIEGDGYVINVDSLTSLFTKFSGSLSNVAINGNLSPNTSGAGFTTVARWNKASGSGIFYDPNGQPKTSTTLGELGMDARAFFGVDFANGNLAKWSNDTKVYNITIYQPDAAGGVNQDQHYVTNSGTGLIGASGAEVAIPNNMFAVSTTSDLTGINNVLYQEAGQYKCAKAEINDKEELYAPYNFTAKELSYNRTLENYNAVCLPFKLKKEYFTDTTVLCTYYGETPTEFQFKQLGTAIPANTPALLWNSTASCGNFSTLTLTDISIEATPTTQIKMREAEKEGDNSKSYGLFKTATAQEIAGDVTQLYRVYGLNKNGGFQFVTSGSKVKFPSLRMVIYSENTTSLAGAAPRRIAILDEMGVDITGGMSAIETVEAEQGTFSVVAGVGEIVFFSDADYGKVEIYSLDGKLAAVADVMAGTTVVNVSNGVYIVMGKKLMVK